MSKNSLVHFYLIYLGFNANVAAGRLCFEFGRRITHHDKKHSTPQDHCSSRHLLLHLLLLLLLLVLLLQLIPTFQSQAKFSPERAKECVDWIEEVLCNNFIHTQLWQVIGAKLEMEVKDQVDFGTVLKDGAVLCQSVSTSTSTTTSTTTTSLPFPLKHPVVEY